jgi:hypothetical protein
MKANPSSVIRFSEMDRLSRWLRLWNNFNPTHPLSRRLPVPGQEIPGQENRAVTGVSFPAVGLRPERGKLA